MVINQRNSLPRLKQTRRIGVCEHESVGRSLNLALLVGEHLVGEALACGLAGLKQDDAESAAGFPARWAENKPANTGDLLRGCTSIRATLGCAADT